MAEVTQDQFVDYIKNISVLELSQLVKKLEAELGVSAAAAMPVAMAGAAAGGGAAAATVATATTPAATTAAAMRRRRCARSTNAFERAQGRRSPPISQLSTSRSSRSTA